MSRDAINEALFATVKGIAAALGDDWTASLPEQPGRLVKGMPTALLTHADGRCVWVYHDSEGTWEFMSGTLPFSTTLSSRDMADGYAMYFKASATDRKTPEQLAREVGRRLLSGYTRTYERDVQLRQARDDGLARAAASLERVCAADRGHSHVIAENDSMPRLKLIPPASSSVRVEFKCHTWGAPEGEFSYDLTIENVPEAVAAKVYAMVAALAYG